MPPNRNERHILRLRCSKYTVGNTSGVLCFHISRAV